MRFNKRISIIFPLFILLLLASKSTATIIKVPQDQPTIQAGIDTAINGDTVLVDTGRYVENINFDGKNIVVGSLFLTTTDTSYISQTVLDGDSSRSVVMFESGEDSTCVLTGFTILNGLGGNIPLEIAWGGGITCNSSSPTLKSIVLTKNRSSWFGGGLYCDNASPALVDVEITGNRADYGGGIACKNKSNAQFLKVTITNNEAENGGGVALFDSMSATFKDVIVSGNEARYGGGILCGRHADPTFEDAEIVGNTADWHGGGIYSYNNASPNLKDVNVSENTAGLVGGGVFCGRSTLHMVDGMVSGNTASWGGGIGCVHESSPKLENVTIWGNTASYGGGIHSFDYSRPCFINVTAYDNVATGGEYGSGGGISSWSSDPVLVNSIFWNNSPQEVYFHQDEEPSSITIAYSDVRGGREGIERTDDGIVNWPEGNIDTDPLFVDAESGDLSLQGDSPCIDAGTAFFVWEGDTIVDLPDTTYDGNAPDMGAFESPYSVAVIDEDALPTEFSLRQPYPNPFNPTTTIEFSMPKSGLVTLTVYDVLGREIETILNQHIQSGHHKVQWNARDVPSGIYFVKMQSGSFSQVRKGMVLR